MRKLFTFLLIVISLGVFCQGGISISPNGSAPAHSAALDINFTNKGFLMPRLTQAQQDSINTPDLGLMVFNTTTNCFDFYTGIFWQPMICSCSAPPAQPSAINGPTGYCSQQGGLTY